MPITDYVCILATDKFGSVFLVDSGSQPDRNITIGGGLPLGIPPDLDKIPEFAAEGVRRLGAGAGEPEFLQVVEHDGKRYHVFYVFCDRDMKRGRSVTSHFSWRWYVERYQDNLTELSRIFWDLIKDRPYQKPTFPMSD